ncbi:MAG: IS110 family transposase [Pseudomonadota bacterium]
MEPDVYVGLDVHKDAIVVALAAPERNGDIRVLGQISNTPQAVSRLVKKLRTRHDRPEFVYEAGSCGYVLYRQLLELGTECKIVAPSRTPQRPGDRIKNDTRDAQNLARLARAGELTYIWVPDPVHEAMRDLVRARYLSAKDVRQARAHIHMYLLKNGVRYDGRRWGYRHREWLVNRHFDHAGQQIAFQSFLNRLEQAEARKSQLEEQIADLCPEWSLGQIVTAIQALKGVGLVVAATLAAEVGDFSRFSSPRHLMAWLGLVPGEFSSGSSIRPRGITKAGNVAARTMIIEAAWCYRTTPKVGRWQQMHRPEVSQEFKDIAWKAQLRLHGRYRKLMARGKRSNVAVTAVARELVGFIWDIARRAAPTGP